MADNIPMGAQPIEVISSDVKPLRSVSVSRFEEIDRTMAQVLNLSEGNIFHETTCLVCSSEYRKEVEELYNKTGSSKQAAEFLAKKSSLTSVSESVIENHFTHHVQKAGIKEIQKLEYINRIKRLNSQSLTTLDKIHLSFSILIERLMGVNSIIPSGEESAVEIEKIKSAETARLTTALNNLLKLQATIMGEMKAEGELIYMPTKEFMEVVKEAIGSARTDREKEIIMTMLNKFEALARKSK
jgi:hypothetical protein